jgi:S1-C subfamily serine protease
MPPSLVERDNHEYKGVIVGEVPSESPAGRAGLKVSDRIIMAGDQQMNSDDDLSNAFASHKPGEKLTLKVERDGKVQAIDVPLSGTPARYTSSKTWFQPTGLLTPGVLPACR